MQYLLLKQWQARAYSLSVLSQVEVSRNLVLHPSADVLEALLALRVAMTEHIGNAFAPNEDEGIKFLIEASDHNMWQLNGVADARSFFAGDMDANPAKLVSEAACRAQRRVLELCSFVGTECCRRELGSQTP